MQSQNDSGLHGLKFIAITALRDDAIVSKRTKVLQVLEKKSYPVDPTDEMAVSR